MGRGRSTSRAAPAVLLLLLFLVVCFSHGAAAARLLLPLQPAAVVVPPLLLHQDQENGVTAAAADGLVFHKVEAAVGNGDHLSFSISEMMGAEEEQDAVSACEEDNTNDDECLQRRLLGDAHLDYIYTQHKGKAMTDRP